MIVLVLDAAGSGCLAGLVRNGALIADRRGGGGRGSAAALPGLAAEVLRTAGLGAEALGRIAVTIGPGSFTGVRAALALGLGMGLAAGVPVVGVTVGAAIRAEAAVARPVWVAVDSRRGRVFLDDAGSIVTVAVDEIPAPRGPIAVGGDAALAVACRLAAQGMDVQLLDVRQAGALGIARAAEREGRAAVPLYVDAIEARPNARRPAPV